jgi:hypothetical protein
MQAARGWLGPGSQHLREAAAHLNEDGMLLVEIGRGRERLENQFPELPFCGWTRRRVRARCFRFPGPDFEALKSR